jgi:hypothetical protein
MSSVVREATGSTGSPSPKPAHSLRGSRLTPSEIESLRNGNARGGRVDAPDSSGSKDRLPAPRRRINAGKAFDKGGRRRCNPAPSSSNASCHLILPGSRGGSGPPRKRVRWWRTVSAKCARCWRAPRVDPRKRPLNSRIEFVRLGSPPPSSSPPPLLLPTPPRASDSKSTTRRSICHRSGQGESRPFHQYDGALWCRRAPRVVGW